MNRGQTERIGGYLAQLVRGWNMQQVKETSPRPT
jgi:hypothetical protein